MTEEQKKWIDNASLVQLLERWRFSKPGDDIFQGECGTYFSNVMFTKRDMNDAAWVAASKQVGW